MKTQKLEALTETLIAKGFVYETRPLSISKAPGRITVVEVGDTSPLDGEISFAEGSSAYYLECIRQGRLSWLLFDASIIQIKFSMKAGNVVSHRYCYIPAPFTPDIRTNFGQELLSWIEDASIRDPINSTRRSLLRFEFDPDAQNEWHAAAHLHLNTPDCRLPMRAPLSVQEFAAFLVANLYSSAFPRDLCGNLPFEGAPTITAAEQERFHVAWTRPAPKR